MNLKTAITPIPQARCLKSRKRRLVRIICEKRPEQLKMEFALSNRGSVKQLIEQECGIKLRIRADGNHLKRWGFTPQKPIKRAYEQRPEAVKKWLGGLKITRRIQVRSATANGGLV